MKNTVLSTLCIFIFFISHAQFSRYIIKFRDKGTNPYSLSNPAAFLSQRALDRRTRYSIPLDSTDLPVTPRYIDSVRLAGAVTILNASKWLNSVTIQTSDTAALTKINTFRFVLATAPIAARIASGNNSNKFQSERTIQAGATDKTEGINDYYNYGLSFPQIHIHNGEFLHDIGLRGDSMIIGMLDAGFYNYTGLHAFDSVNNNGQVLGVFDFVAHDGSVVEDDAHGMECFSTMAANLPGSFVGTAPKADFYLFRTEDASSEYPVEEHNWVCGAERVDSSGGDVISSSLGYNQFDNSIFDHTYADMNGKTTMAAIGATMAARKGILVLNAAGNEGNNAWHYIVTPADADSILTVGAVNTSGIVASFSSYGPSSDGRIKPDVASVGQNAVVESPGNYPGNNNGTSFACPNMAGLTTCLWEGFKEFNNIRIIHALQQAGSIANAPDNHIGYGIPDVKKALLNLIKDYSTSSATISNCTTILNWTSKDFSNMKYEIERQLPGQGSFTKIGELFGTGASFSKHSYAYNDTLVNVQAGNALYRIREIIDTSAAGFMADYIDTATVTISAACITTGINEPANSNFTILVTPNPVESNVNLTITTPDFIRSLDIRIINAIGQEVYNKHTSKQPGIISIPIDISRLAKNKYFLSVYKNGKLLGTKEVLKL